MTTVTVTGYRLASAARTLIFDDLNYDPVRDALTDLISGGHTGEVYLWESVDTGKPDPSIPGRTITDWRLVTIRNPAPQRLRPAHRADCDDDELCACEPTVPVPLPAWCNLFAGLTLSPLFHLHPADRARLTALQWPAPKDAEGWTYPDGTTTG
ncbi:hypothetical protein [Kitasatospora sp. NPDC088779]|uniref:hypothetical protein n=1 Tax=Kitasatospora sp. NPDC088779 TaxID=3154964 RepID=UPI0034494AD4